MANTYLKERLRISSRSPSESAPRHFLGSICSIISGQQPSSIIDSWVDRSQIGMEKLEIHSRWRMVGVEVSLPAGPDRDGDGLDDPTEAKLATSPDQADTDETVA